MERKSFSKKAKLAKAERQNRRLPMFVAVRTKREITYNSVRRSWRTDKLRKTED